MIVRIPIGLASLISSKRVLVNKYHTNHTYKIYATWIACKSLTTTDNLVLSPEIRVSLSKLLCCSSSTMYAYLNKAQKEDLIAIERGQHLPNRKTPQPFSIVKLKSWNAILEIHSLIKEFYFIQSNQIEQVGIHRILQALEYHENRLKQILAYQTKIQKYPVINRAAQKVAERNDYAFNCDIELHKAAREYLFSEGGSEAEYEILFRANPDFNRCAKTIQGQKNMKSHTTAIYEQKVLNKLNLIVSTRRAPAICAYNMQKDKNLVKGKAVHCVRVYAKDDKVAYWNKPNDIQLKIDGLLSEKEGVGTL